ncbi:hypothetical protein BGZ57DRAFT_913311 [Hyaloscypha finlandica]|nr:hypothetical protein BGZ57DRAFT_913311 [Hyaloscypha finlandica]
MVRFIAILSFMIVDFGAWLLEIRYRFSSVRCIGFRFWRHAHSICSNCLICADVCSSSVPDAADVSLSSLISCHFSAPTGFLFGQPVRLRAFSDI